MDRQDCIELFRALAVSEVEVRAQHNSAFLEISREISNGIYGGNTG